MGSLNDGTVHLGYNNQRLNFSFDASDVYTVSADPIRRKLGSFRDEMVRAAREITSSIGAKRIYVMYSGGIDSEAVVEAFRLANLPATAVCVRYSDDLNGHDMKHAQEYFDRTGYRDYRFIDFDVRKWLASSECRDFSREIQMIEQGYTSHLKVALDELGDGVTIYCHEEPTVWRLDDANTGARRWVFHSHERHYSVYKFFMKYGLTGVPSFFQWSTELLNSFMINPYWVALFNGLYNPTVWNSEQLKYGFYASTLDLKARKKYTGYEKLISTILSANRDLKSDPQVIWNRYCDVDIFDWYERCKVKTI